MTPKDETVTQHLGGSTSLTNKTQSPAPVFVCWAGFTQGQLHIESMDDHWGGRNERHVPALFLTRKEARKQFQDVRKVQVRLVGRGEVAASEVLFG